MDHAVAVDSSLARSLEPGVTVCIATVGRRVLGLTQDRLPMRVGLRYHVVLQSPDAEGRAHLRELARRGDIGFLEQDGRGAARSRNLALATAPGDIAVLADDDLELLVDSYPALVRAFAQEPDLGCICGMVLGAGGRLRKRLAADGARLRLWNAARVGTPEIVLRLAEVRRLGLRFDERFGAGTDLPLGDEFVFLVDGLRAGLKGRHRSLPLAVHPHESSGMDFDGPSLEVRRKVFARAAGRAAWVLRLGFAAKNARRFGTLWDALRFLRP